MRGWSEPWKISFAMLLPKFHLAVGGGTLLQSYDRIAAGVTVIDRIAQSYSHIATPASIGRCLVALSSILNGIATQAADWIAIERGRGPDAISTVYAEMLGGKINPAVGHILSPRRIIIGDRCLASIVQFLPRMDRLRAFSRR